MEVVHPGQARELVWSAECWPAELAGLAFAETKQLWLVRVIRGVEPARLWPATASGVEPEAREASPPISEGRSAATARPACTGDSPYLSWLGEWVARTTAATRGVIRPNASAPWSR